jgi:hypothetical protein
VEVHEVRAITPRSPASGLRFLPSKVPEVGLTLRCELCCTKVRETPVAPYSQAPELDLRGDVQTHGFAKREFAEFIYPSGG